MKSAIRVFILLVFTLCLSGLKAGDKEKMVVSKNQAFPIQVFPTLDGSFASLADYRGKKTLLINFGELFSRETKSDVTIYRKELSDTQCLF